MNRQCRRCKTSSNKNEDLPDREQKVYCRLLQESVPVSLSVHNLNVQQLAVEFAARKVSLAAALGATWSCQCAAHARVSDQNSKLLSLKCFLKRPEVADCCDAGMLPLFQRLSLQNKSKTKSKPWSGSRSKVTAWCETQHPPHLKQKIHTCAHDSCQERGIHA